MASTLKILGKIDLSKFDKPKFTCKYCRADSFMKTLHLIPFAGYVCSDCIVESEKEI
jgi:hypothetical protein